MYLLINPSSSDIHRRRGPPDHRRDPVDQRSRQGRTLRFPLIVKMSRSDHDSACEDADYRGMPAAAVAASLALYASPPRRFRRE
ncbi:Hypothetical protein SMAX5B_013067 [Scophthalmus maximus]|uniref:Uncharacterized protein n=1 Tax=Scophthalmus maximus TaxID=52904 RepID=A0A2U9BDA1_SCOMX|nr:Hypothetical protein SMAX5B_013067 [Scophthalmus maximus]